MLYDVFFWNKTINYKKSKKEGKDQESIQSSTTPVGKLQRNN